MSIHRRAAKRDSNEPEIVLALQRAGASVTRISERGAPDLLVGFQGLTFLLEVKAEKGAPTLDQIRWRRDWQGGPTCIVRSVDEALQTIGAVTI